MLIKDISFRDLEHKLLLIKPTASLIDNIAKMEEKVDANNTLLVYGYNDHSQGFCFQLLGLYDGDKCLKNYNDKLLIFERGSVDECEVVDGEYNIDDYLERISSINDTHKPSHELEEVRSLLEIESCRHQWYPDDVMVYVINKAGGMEACWARTQRIENKQIIGTLLNEPYHDFGIHFNDEIVIRLFNNKEDDSIHCVYLAD